MKQSGVRALVARVSQEQLERMVVPDGPVIINGCTDLWHPSQSLADLRAMQEALGSLANRTLGFIGDGDNPVFASLASDAIRCGMRVRLIGPTSPRDEIDQFAQMQNAEIEHSTEIGAIAGCEVIYTDEWRYRELSADEREYFSKYRLNSELIERHAQKAMIMHCLPFGDEIEPDLLYSKRSLVWRQIYWRPSALAAAVHYAS